MTNTNSKPKRRVKQNVWGNINGYEGTRKVREFTLNTPEIDIERWIAGANCLKCGCCHCNGCDYDHNCFEAQCECTTVKPERK